MSILRLVEMEKAVVEGAGAIGLAAVLGDYVPELRGKKYATAERTIVASTPCPQKTSAFYFVE